MQPIRIKIAPKTAADNCIAASQSPGSSALTLTALAAGPIDPNVTNNQSGLSSPLLLGRILSITSGGNDTGITFAVVGVDQNGVSVSENVTGASGAAAVTTKYYTSVSSITPSGAVASTVKVGIVNTTASAALQTLVLDPHARIAPVVQVDVGDTISYTVQMTFDDVNSPQAVVDNAVFFDTPATPTALTAQSASKYDVLVAGTCGLAVTIPTYSAGGSIIVNVVTPSNSNMG